MGTHICTWRFFSSQRPGGHRSEGRGAEGKVWTCVLVGRRGLVNIEARGSPRGASPLLSGNYIDYLRATLALPCRRRIHPLLSTNTCLPLEHCRRSDACSQSRRKYRSLPRPYAVPCIILRAAMSSLSEPSSGEYLQWCNKVVIQQRVPSAALPARLCPLATDIRVGYVCALRIPLILMQ